MSNVKTAGRTSAWMSLSHRWRKGSGERDQLRVTIPYQIPPLPPRVDFIRAPAWPPLLSQNPCSRIRFCHRAAHAPNDFVRRSYHDIRPAEPSPAIVPAPHDDRHGSEVTNYLNPPLSNLLAINSTRGSSPPPTFHNSLSCQPHPLASMKRRHRNSARKTTPIFL
jgi:hypothetical protein